MIPQKIQVMNTLKEQDANRFLLSLFIRKDECSNAIRVIDVLNIELSSIRDHIETPHMGYIRLQWWRDEIKKLYERSNDNPPHFLLEELKKIVSSAQVSFQDIDALISAREIDFEDHDIFDLYEYARKTHIPLMTIKSKILSENRDVNHLAEAYAVLGLIMAVPFYRERSQVFIPEISPSAVKEKVDYALELLNKDTTQHRYFKAHKVLAMMTASHLAKNGYNPENITPIPFKELRLWWGTLLAK